MPPKRKRVVKEENNIEVDEIAHKKIKRHDVSANFASPSLQSLPAEVVHIIMGYLKSCFKDPLPLGLTSSKWHNELNSSFANDLRHFLPMSYHNCTKAQRNAALESFYSFQKSIRDVQLFEFTKTTTNELGADLQIYAVPWQPNIVFAQSANGALIDLRNNQVLESFPPGNGSFLSTGRLCSANADRKQVVVVTSTRPDEDDEEVPSLCLRVYSVSDSMKVTLVTKFSLQIEEEGDDEFGPPKLVFLSSDGVVWYSDANGLKRFSIKNNSEIETNFGLNDLKVMGIGEYNKRVLIFCADYEGSPISVFDSEAEDFVGELDQSDVLMDIGDEQQQMTVVVKNDMALVVDGNDEIQAVYQMESLAQLFYWTRDVPTHASLSYDHKKLAVFEQKNQLSIYNTTNQQVSHVISGKFGKLLSATCWIEGHSILAAKDKRIAIFGESALEVDEQSFVPLPLKKKPFVKKDIAVVGNTVFIADFNRQSAGFSIYRLTI